MILQHHYLHCFIRYFLPFLFFASCWVWFWIVTLPPQLEYFYLELLSVLESILPWRSLFRCLVQPTWVDSLKVPVIAFQMHPFLFVFIWEEGGHRSLFLPGFTVLPVHAWPLLYSSVFLMSLKGERFITSTMKESSEYLVRLFSSAFCIL